MFDKIHKDQQGSVLLYTLMILSIMTIAGFVLASLSLRQVSIARTADDGVRSFYAAESGLERSLDLYGEHREVNDLLQSTFNAIESSAPPSTPVSLTNSDTEYEVDPVETGTIQGTVTLPVLPQSSPTQIELYDVDDPVGTFMNAESMELLWDHPQCGTTSRIEATFFEFDTSQFTLDLNSDSIFKQLLTCSPPLSGSDRDCQAISNVLSPNTNYIVRLTAYDCVLLNTDITFYTGDNASGSVVGIPSRARLSVVGSAQQTERRMSAVVKWLPSPSGLVDYVFFSLGRVVK